MAKQKNKSEVQEKRELGSRLWLTYYNQTLYERGVITEQERNRMALKINEWKSLSM